MKKTLRIFCSFFFVDVKNVIKSARVVSLKFLLAITRIKLYAKVSSLKISFRTSC